MQFLKTLLWVTFLVGLTVFAINNWVPVTVSLWGGLRLDTKLPALVILSFLLGFLPLFILHRMTTWRMKRRIATLESNQRLSATGSAIASAPPVAPTPAYTPGNPL
jgi:lipopolysaccharide assembly protein A